MPRGIPNDPTKRRGASPEDGGQDAFELPADMAGQKGAVLLLDACNRYGVNPDMTLPVFKGRGAGPFRELMSWKFYPGERESGMPDSVVLVTAGGVKIRHQADPDFPMDEDTENRLRQVFRAWKTDPKTNEIVPLPLPDDLTLPRTAVTGQVDPNHGHQYRAGYLRRKSDE